MTWPTWLLALTMMGLAGCVTGLPEPECRAYEHLDEALACAHKKSDGELLWVEAQRSVLTSAGPGHVCRWSFGFREGGQTVIHEQRNCIRTEDDEPGWSRTAGQISHPFHTALNERHLEGLRDLPTNRSLFREDQWSRVTWTLADWGHGPRWNIHAVKEGLDDVETTWAVDLVTGRDVVVTQGLHDNPFGSLASEEALQTVKETRPSWVEAPAPMRAKAWELEYSGVVETSDGLVWIPADGPMGDGMAPAWVVDAVEDGEATMYVVRGDAWMSTPTDANLQGPLADPEDSRAAMEKVRRACGWRLVTYSLDSTGWTIGDADRAAFVGADGVECGSRR